MDNIYLIYGSNYDLIKEQIKKISSGYEDVVKYDLLEVKIDDALDDASCMSIFGDKKVVIGENALFLTGNNCEVDHDINYLCNYLNYDKHDNILILTAISDKLDERKKIVKLLKEKAKVIYLQKIDEKNISSFVILEFKKRGYIISNETANYFIDYVGNNVDIVLNEINKMIIYKDNDKEISIDDINNISSKAYKDNIFDFTDAIMKKDHKKIFECYNDLIKLNEEPVKLISVIASQFIFIYQVKLLDNEGKNQSKIVDLLKVHPYRVKLALENNYLIKDITKVIKKLHLLDYNVKSGNMDKNEALKDFLLKL